MEHVYHAHARPDHQSLNAVAWAATLHCLTGCAIGEVLGMVIGTSLGWGNGATIALAVVLAFFFGYLLTVIPLLKARLGTARALKLALAALAAFPINRWLIARGKGHAVVHAHHGVQAH